MSPILMRRLGLATLSLLAVLVAGLFLFVKGEPSGARAELADLLVGEMAFFELTEGAAPLTGTSFVDETGVLHSLEEYRGKIILLNLWATWCAPCLHEMPTLDRLKRDMDAAGYGDDFDVLAISVDRAEVEKSKAFLDRTGATHLALLVDQTQKLTFALKAYQLPTTILLDRNGIEVGRIAGDKEWDHKDVKNLVKHLIEVTGEEESGEEGEP